MVYEEMAVNEKYVKDLFNLPTKTSLYDTV